ncbi:SRPBCC domain-containing protein [Phenylobacterium sp.]|jgi:uncharacterized protein YndB with AHSA1/START domain|uniref:SRPBCC domain-containing protein n=1 Tax=Phenylobacterium sp. TaxID=1871053 RepID=UPI002E312CE6|nr:SRPBCC domain-containing protein [Phenylobacterium sp.]HEX4709346.1 SRPBCC domain-containing protein [Phenylobacterium sp.]
MSAVVQLADHDPREFIVTRIFRAPRPLVFKVWTEPQYVAQWWGIDGATNPECELDLRAGGRWRIVMRTASGRLYPNQGTFLEVVPNERLVYSDVHDPELPEWEGRPPEAGVHTVIFEDVGQDTRVTLRVRLGAPADRDRMLALGAPKGLAQGFERLARLLATLAEAPSC